jgi:hypothetical protein
MAGVELHGSAMGSSQERGGEGGEGVLLGGAMESC